MKKTILGSIVAGTVLAMTALSAQAQDTVRMGFAAEPYPPFASPDSAGNWVGWEVELMEAVCAEMKANCELVPVAWDGIIPALLEKKIDVIWASMSITEERKQQISFTDKYYNTPAHFIGPKSSDIKPDPANPDSVAGKIIGVQTSTIHANYAEKAFGSAAEVKLYDTQDNANADLVAGGVDLILADSIALDAFMKSDQGKDMEVKLVAPDDPIFGEGVGGGLRKEDTALRDKINTAIKAVRENGKYDEISKKYFDFDIYGG
jgi:polar amino acid transport system substrate-binding protein